MATSDSNGRVIFDCEALSRAIAHNKYMYGVVLEAHQQKQLVVVPATTIIEAVHAKTNRDSLNWLLSRLEVAPVTHQIATDASDMLIKAKLHGHEYALDAVVCAVALAHPRCYFNNIHFRS